MHEQNHYIYEFGPFHLDATRRVLLRSGEPVKLFPKEFDTLLALVERNGEVMEKDDLMQHVWQGQIVEESNLTTNISHLRRLLGEKRGSHDYIVTVPGRGYRFVAGVRQAFDEVIVRERTRITIEEEEIDPAETSAPGERKNGCQTQSSDTVRSVSTNNGDAERIVVAQTAAAPLPIPAHAKARSLFSLTSLMLIVAVAVTVASAAAFFLYDSRLVETHTPFQNVALKQLTTNSKTTLATLSPDGQLFIYVARDGGKEGLWVGHVSGGGESVSIRSPEDVTYRSLKFSADGGSLYYVVVSDEHRDGALFRMPAFGGVSEKLREGVGVMVAFAPDMRQFAYTHDDAAKGISSLIIADTTGKDERELVTRPYDHPFRSLSPSWSPDREKIAVSAVTDANAETYEVFLVSVATGEIKPLTALAWTHVASTVWLPDGSGLVIVAKEKGAWDGFQLWHVSLPGGAARRILPDLDSYGAALSLSADGKLLLASQEQRITNVWVTPTADLSRAKQVTFGSVGRRDGWENLDWTPDGKLVYGAVVRESLTIWTMDADGSNQKQLTSHGYRDSRLSTAADGLLIFESNRNGPFEIWRSRLDGTDMKQLTAGGGNTEPHVSPDGKWVVYTSSRDGLKTLWRISLEGGEPERIADQSASWPRVSPDGKLIACEYYARLDSRRAQLAIIPIAGGSPTKLFDVPRLANFHYGIRWTPDGKAVTYRDWANGIWRQPLRGGNPERLTGLPEEKLYAYAWSRDGKRFAFVRGAEIRDVILLRNIK